MKIVYFTGDHLRGFDRSLDGIEGAITQAIRVRDNPFSNEIERRVSEGVIEAMELAKRTVERHLEPMRAKSKAA